MLTEGFQRFWLDETPGWAKPKLFHHLCCLLSHHSGKCEDFHLRLAHGCKNVQINWIKSYDDAVDATGRDVGRLAATARLV